MLHSLCVKNLALIDEIEIDLKDGLNILTGETGAGKSIILGSINLALGGRCSSDMLRDPKKDGYVELVFSVSKPSQIAFLKERDLYPEEGMIILSRKLMGGRSVARINGETVSAAILKEAASILIDIHGQHEHQSLLYKKNHLTILDTFAKDTLGDVKQETAECYREYKACRHELSEATLDEKEREKEIRFLEFEIKEIQEANLTIGEDSELEDTYRRMVHGKRIRENLDEAYEYTAGFGNGASELLSRSIRLLLDAARFDERAGEITEQLSEVDSLLNDFNRELSDYRASLEFSEEAFYETESRLNEINHLKSKYGNTIEEILSYREEKEERLKTLSDYDRYLAELREKEKAAGDRLFAAAKELSALRKEAAKKLEMAIREGLLDLNFLDVQFQIVFRELSDYTSLGMDEAEFMISMNPGEPVRPLGEVASGGELSRIMLAIKTVMAEKDQIETLIFDEIDVGISGRTAQKVSEKMAVIGRDHQVICITHLAQIAAMADAHYAIEKKVTEGKTKTTISLLGKDEEIGELARILGGAEITEKVLESAAEMKELAKGAKELIKEAK